MASIDHSHHQYHPPNYQNTGNFDIFKPLRKLLNGIEVKNYRLAHLICQLIPCCCPFERHINLFGRTLFHIPALCKLNPLYNEVVGLRFRALSYLADECGEDVTQYIC
jgi:hypothetical protein